MKRYDHSNKESNLRQGFTLCAQINPGEKKG
jgi:hypothetical protein